MESLTWTWTSTGECKEYMTRYLKCMKENKQQSTECRHLSKEYLACRMDKYVARLGVPYLTTALRGLD